MNWKTAVNPVHPSFLHPAWGASAGVRVTSCRRGALRFPTAAGRLRARHFLCVLLFVRFINLLCSLTDVPVYLTYTEGLQGSQTKRIRSHTESEGEVTRAQRSCCGGRFGELVRAAAAAAAHKQELYLQRCLQPPLTHIQENMKDWGSVWPSFLPAHFLVLWTDFSVWGQRIQPWHEDQEGGGL